MILRITREEGEWLRGVLCGEVVAAAERLQYVKVCSDEYRIRAERDRDVATGMIGMIDDAMKPKARR